MRLPILLLLFTLLTTSSCQEKRKAVSPLSRDEMVNLMMEIYLAEARASLVPAARDSSYRLFVAYQDSILQRRSVSDTTLRKAYAYYLEHPAELEAIYDAIIDSLSLKEQLLRGSPPGRP